MPHPPRVAHLVPLNLLAEQLAPSYAEACNRLPEEVYDEVRSGLDEARLKEPLLEALWTELSALRPRLQEPALIEILVKAMAARKGQGPRPASASESVRMAMNPLMAVIDVNVGRASDTARAALESVPGQKMLATSVKAAGAFLAGRVLSAVRIKDQGGTA